MLSLHIYSWNQTFLSHSCRNITTSCRAPPGRKCTSRYLKLFQCALYKNVMYSDKRHKVHTVYLCHFYLTPTKKAKKKAKKTQKNKVKPTTQFLKMFVTNTDTGQERQHFLYHRQRCPAGTWLHLALLPMNVSEYHIMLKRSLIWVCLNSCHQVMRCHAIRSVFFKQNSHLSIKTLSSSWSVKSCYATATHNENYLIPCMELVPSSATGYFCQFKQTEAAKGSQPPQDIHLGKELCSFHVFKPWRTLILASHIGFKNWKSHTASSFASISQI